MLKYSDLNDHLQPSLSDRLIDIFVNNSERNSFLGCPHLKVLCQSCNNEVEFSKIHEHQCVTLKMTEFKKNLLKLESNNQSYIEVTTERSTEI